MNLKIDDVRIADLEAIQRPIRNHGPKQLTRRVESIKRFGVSRRIVLEEHGNAVAGHGRANGEGEAA